MLARHPLLFLGGLAGFHLICVCAPRAAAQTPYSVTGVVHDESNAPVTSAELRLARGGHLEQSARTGADGRFIFNGVQPGDLQISVRRMGYRVSNRSVTVTGTSQPSPLDIALQTVATDVDPVMVEGEDAKMKEFNLRRGSNNFGKYFDGDEIMKRDPRLTSELLRTVPGASIGASTRVGNRVLLRGCKPTIFVNGMKAYGAELDEVAYPSDVAGLEVYLSWAGLPPQYQDRENPGCGAIIVWTRDK
jgi:carboxypeptidase family protein